jgi:hypothetical protein
MNDLTASSSGSSNSSTGVKIDKKKIDKKRMMSEDAMTLM